MKQALHLLKKDLRRLWPLVALILALLCIQLVGEFQDPLAVEQDPGGYYHSLVTLFHFAVILAVAMLIQQEPLVGSTAFWLTRPISRLSLMAAKAMFLTFFLIVPAVAAKFWVLAAYGLEPERYLSALLETLGPHLAAVLAGVALAVVTPNVPIYIMAWIAAIVLLQISAQLLQKFFGITSWVWAGSGSLLSMVLVIPAASLLAIHQYLTRTTRRSLFGLVVGFALLAVVSALCPWDLLWALGERYSPKRELRLAVSADGEVFAAQLVGAGKVEVFGRPSFSGGPPGHAFGITRLEGELELETGERIPFHDNSVVGSMSGDGVLEVLGAFKWVGDQKPEAPSLTLLLVDSGVFDRLVAKTGRYRARVRGHAYRYRVASTLPLKVGARFEEGSAAAVIRGISRRNSGLLVTLRHRHIRSLLGNETFPQVLLVNRGRREALHETSSDHRFLPHVSLPQGPQVAGSERTMQYRLEPLSGEEPSGLLADAWLRQAELMFLERVPEGQFTTSFSIEDFRTADYTFGE